jgi:hypothetical protein
VAAGRGSAAGSDRLAGEARIESNRDAAVPDYVVEWTNGAWRQLWRSGWRITEPHAELFLFSALSLAVAPRRLGREPAKPQHQSPPLPHRFRWLVPRGGEFLSWWLQTCGRGDGTWTRFLLRFPEPIWEIPWELLLGELRPEYSSRVSIVRGVPGDPRRLPGELDRALRVLLVQGEENAYGQPLNLRGEAERIIECWECLPLGVRDAVGRPTVVQPGLDDLGGCLAQHLPDVLWFSGHAEASPPKFALKGGGMLTPETLEAAVNESGAAPVFALFWACETARRGRGNGPSAPPFYRTLAHLGCMQILAMQEQISDEGAILMASEAFSALASGEALDVAVSRARHAMRSATGDRFFVFDWACPTVWGSGLSPTQLSWSTPATGRAALQVSLARARARLSLGDPDTAPSMKPGIIGHPLSADARLTWTVANTYGADLEQWGASISATQKERPVFAVVVKFGDGETEPKASLRAWAESLVRTMEPSTAADGLRTVLEGMTAEPTDCWSRMCRLPGILVGVVNPPSYEGTSWFWDPLRSTHAPVAVLSEHGDDTLLRDGWSVENIGMEPPASDDSIAADRTAAALALLRVSVPEEALGLGTSQPLTKALVRIRGRYVALAGQFSRAVRASITKEAERDGHVRCLEILSDESLSARRAEPPLHEEMLHHALAAAEAEAAVAEATVLFEMYRTLDRPRAAISVVERIQKHWRSVPRRWLIYAAWAYVMIGELGLGSFWLDRAEASSPIERAWIHGLRAEIYKASGEADSKMRALAEINSAIQAIHDGTSPDETRRLRSYRQDRARIRHYLFRRPDEAQSEWETLLSEWEGLPDAQIDRAYVLRNLSSCLRDQTTLGTPEWLRAKSLLATAMEELRLYPDHPLRAEIIYEQGRIALSEARRSEAADLLKMAAASAERSGNTMVAAISDARAFWEFEPFSAGQWETFDARLCSFPRHGWAVRTSIDGGLRFARRMAGVDRSRALAMVLSCRARLQLNPSFDEGSDRFRIAATAAGIFELTGSDHSAWNEFLALPWAAAWLSEASASVPTDVWQQVA